MFNNKRDVLLESVKKIMQESDLHRKLEAQVNEAFGVTSRSALPRERVAEYDAMLAEAKKKGGLHPNQQKLDVHKPEEDELTADDFRMLRSKKKVVTKEETQAMQYEPSGSNASTGDRNKAKSHSDEERASLTNLVKKTTEEPDRAGLTKKIDQIIKEPVKEERAYAIGMAAAEKATGDKPPLKKSTIKKAQKIAKAIMKKKMNESLEALHEEIRTSLWERLDYIYENCGEDAAMEAYAALTEEERFILEQDDEEKSDGPPLKRDSDGLPIQRPAGEGFPRVWDDSRQPEHNPPPIDRSPEKPQVDATGPGMGKFSGTQKAEVDATGPGMGKFSGTQKAEVDATDRKTMGAEAAHRAKYNQQEPTTGTGKPKQTAPAPKPAAPAARQAQPRPARASGGSDWKKDVFNPSTGG